MIAQFADGLILRGGGFPGGIKLWLKADIGITLSGSGVSTWADQSGLGNDATQSNSSNQPTVTASSINGLPGIHFTGNQGLTNTTTNLLTSGQSRTLIAVVKPGSSTDSILNIRIGGTGWLARLITTTGTTKEIYNSISGSSDTVDPGHSLSGAGHVIEISTVVGSLPTVAIDTVTLTATPNSGNGLVVSDTGTTGFNVGCYIPGSGNGFGGDINELILFDHILSSGDLTIVRTYLLNKWGIS